MSFVNTAVAEVSFLTNFNSSKGTLVYKKRRNDTYQVFFDLNDTYTCPLLGNPFLFMNYNIYYVK